MSDYTPATLTLVRGKIKRGDTINSWSFSLAGIPSPEDAVAVFSAHLDELDTAPLIELVSPDDITLSVEDGKLLGEVPMINAPGGPGKLFWELEIRVPTVYVAGPEGGVWTRTVFAGAIQIVQDGARRNEP